MAHKSYRAQLRKFILSLPLDGCIRLTLGVFVNDHETPGRKWHLPIRAVERWGKRGVAMVTDGINGWTLNELTEAECREILTALREVPDGQP